MQDSKERALPTHDSQTLEDHLVFLKHVALYRFAGAYVMDKRALDLGCGEGYGSAALANSARWVVAADRDPDAVAHAAAKYAHPRVTFVVCDAQRLPFQADAFQVVVSYEVIEHIPDVQLYLKEVQRAASIVLISTPNRDLRLLPFQKPWNRFHLREYAAPDFSRMLGRVFRRVELRGVNAIPGVLEIEKRRVKQNPLIAYPRMIAQMLLPRRAYDALKSFKPMFPRARALPASTRLQGYSESDYQITSETRGCINLLALCQD